MIKKKYYAENKHIITQKFKQYREQNRDKWVEHGRNYYKQNRDKLCEDKKEYREQNKDRIKEHASQRITCICGPEIRRADKAKHERTAKHQRIVNEAETWNNN